MGTVRNFLLFVWGDLCHFDFFISGGEHDTMYCVQIAAWNWLDCFGSYQRRPVAPSRAKCHRWYDERSVNWPLSSLSSISHLKIIPNSCAKKCIIHSTGQCLLREWVWLKIGKYLRFDYWQQTLTSAGASQRIDCLPMGKREKSLKMLCQK